MVNRPQYNALLAQLQQAVDNGPITFVTTDATRLIIALLKGAYGHDDNEGGAPAPSTK